MGAKNWERYTRLQAALAAQLRKPALFFLQPNLNVKDSKPLSEEELHFFSSDSNRLEDQKDKTRAYGYLRNAVRNLQSRGVRVVDWTDILKFHKETLYIDSCCHLGEQGNILIEEELVRQIAHEVRF